jgi:MoxR-like ATPase
LAFSSVGSADRPFFVLRDKFVRPSEVSLALEALLSTRHPLYLWGAPGVGESSVVRQAAEKP